MFGLSTKTSEDNKLIVASIIGTNRHGNLYHKNFYNSEDLIKEIKTNVLFKNSYIYCNNLSFDFWSVFFTQEDRRQFKILPRGSDMLMAETYYIGNEFTIIKKIKDRKNNSTRASLTFLDTMNFTTKTIEELGKEINLPRLCGDIQWCDSDIYDEPATLEDLTDVNEQDALICLKFMESFNTIVQELGATPKITIAATTMSCYRNKYVSYEIYQPSKEILREDLFAYYGGRTECFKRGTFYGVYKYDINSLYPAVMEYEEFPDPNSRRTNRKDTIDYIENYHGYADVTIEIPGMKVGPLPYKLDDKLTFPTGTIDGYWNNIELREALKLGCKITKVRKNVWYTRTMRPFKKYIQTLYALRLHYKELGNDVYQFIIKIMMNSFYGKFGQKFDDVNGLMQTTEMTKELYKTFKQVIILNDEFFRVIEDQEPRLHCIPIWASYVTSYARIRLNELLINHNPIYCDTDSIFTKDKLETSSLLGGLKLEEYITEGITVSAKMYATKHIDKGDIIEDIKIKGLGIGMTFERFKQLANEPRVDYMKVLKLKESFQFGLAPNDSVLTHKTFELEDTKRLWPKQFSMDELQDSTPIHIGEEIEEYLDTFEQEDLFDYELLA